MIGRVLAILSLAALIPAVWLLADGGADLHLGSERLLLFGDETRPLWAAGAAALALIANQAGKRAAVATILTAVFAALAAGETYMRSLAPGYVPLPSPEMPAVAAIACGIIAAFPTQWGWRRFAIGTVAVAVAVVLGAGAMWAMERKHADRFVRAFPSPSSAAATAAGATATGSPAAQRPDVIFLLIDTLRADAVGAYGGPPTPFMDRLADEAVVFERVVAQAPWTLPSVASFLTSVYPTTLRPAREPWEQMPRVPTELPWLQKRFQDAGYHTAGFTKNGLLRPGTGFESGFDIYDFVEGHSAELESAHQMVDAVARWAAAAGRHRTDGKLGPFFLYVHVMDPHTPYRPPLRFLNQAALAYDGAMDGTREALAKLPNLPGGPSEQDYVQLRRLYDAEVAYTDFEMERLRAVLQKYRLWTDETLVVLVSDHGEQLGEHGDFEHDDIHAENVMVPWMMKVPGVSARRYEPTVRLLDLAPTLGEIAGLASVSTDEGRSLAKALDAPVRAMTTAITEYNVAGRIEDERHTLLVDESGWDLFDWQRDPTETEDLSEQRKAVAERLRTSFDSHGERERPDLPQAVGGNIPADKHLRKMLRTLGYLD